MKEREWYRLVGGIELNFLEGSRKASCLHAEKLKRLYSNSDGVDGRWEQGLVLCTQQYF
jgi:hypothetical protein